MSSVESSHSDFSKKLAWRSCVDISVLPVESTAAMYRTVYAQYWSLRQRTLRYIQILSLVLVQVLIVVLVLVLVQKK